MCVCACDDERLSFVSEIKRVFTDMCFKGVITFMFCVNEDALTGTAHRPVWVKCLDLKVSQLNNLNFKCDSEWRIGLLYS